ncbi:hypothetical protein GCM10009811_28920 [Nostocoides veronense]|uniref:Uncharacterized protein n=1 Tax=Nostocoides veronense TaxID=330836 RepID=A0ABN2LYP7_9MICO
MSGAPEALNGPTPQDMQSQLILIWRWQRQSPQSRGRRVREGEGLGYGQCHDSGPFLESVGLARRSDTARGADQGSIAPLTFGHAGGSGLGQAERPMEFVACAGRECGGRGG